MCDKLVTESGISWDAFQLVIVADDECHHIEKTVYVTQDAADATAVWMSQQFPKGTVKLEKMARIKAVYKNGKRVRVFDYNDFYSNLTPEQYAATKIKDSRTAELL